MCSDVRMDMNPVWRISVTNFCLPGFFQSLSCNLRVDRNEPMIIVEWEGIPQPCPPWRSQPKTEGTPGLESLPTPHGPTHLKDIYSLFSQPSSNALPLQETSPSASARRRSHGEFMNHGSIQRLVSQICASHLTLLDKYYLRPCPKSDPA